MGDKKNALRQKAAITLVFFHFSLESVIDLLTHTSLCLLLHWRYFLSNKAEWNILGKYTFWRIPCFMVCTFNDILHEMFSAKLIETILFFY